MIKIDELLIDEIRNTMNDHFKKVQELQEKVIKEVLKNYLGREPILEDYFYCTKLCHINTLNEFHIAYKGITLGKLRTSFEGDRYICEFTI